MNLLMATVLPPAASDELAESEPVLVEVDALTVTLTLDTGERIVLDREELALALSGSGQGRQAA